VCGQRRPPHRQACTIDAAWAVGRAVVAVSASAMTGRSAVLFVTYYFTIFHIFFKIIFIIPFIPVATMPQTHGHDHNIITFPEQRPAQDDEYNNTHVRGGGAAGGNCSRTKKKTFVKVLVEYALDKFQ